MDDDNRCSSESSDDLPSDEPFEIPTNEIAEQQEALKEDKGSFELTPQDSQYRGVSECLVNLTYVKASQDHHHRATTYVRGSSIREQSMGF